jgi:hypothetical protein
MSRTINFIYQHGDRRYGDKAARVVLEDIDNSKRVKDAVQLLYDRDIPIGSWNTQEVKVLCSVIASERLDCNGQSFMLNEEDLLHCSLNSESDYVVVGPKRDEPTSIIDSAIKEEDEEVIVTGEETISEEEDEVVDTNEEAIAIKQEEEESEEPYDFVAQRSLVDNSKQANDHSSSEPTATDKNDDDDLRSPAPVSSSGDTAESDDTNTTISTSASSVHAQTAFSPSTTVPQVTDQEILDTVDKLFSEADILNITVKDILASVEDLCQLLLKKDKKEMIKKRLTELVNNAVAEVKEKDDREEESDHENEQGYSQNTRPSENISTRITRGSKARTSSNDTAEVASVAASRSPQSATASSNDSTDSLVTTVKRRSAVSSSQSYSSMLNDEISSQNINTRITRGSKKEMERKKRTAATALQESNEGKKKNRPRPKMLSGERKKAKLEDSRRNRRNEEHDLWSRDFGNRVNTKDLPLQYRKVPAVASSCLEQPKKKRILYFAAENDTPTKIATMFELRVERVLYDNRQIKEYEEMTSSTKFTKNSIIVLPLTSSIPRSMVVMM